MSDLINEPIGTLGNFDISFSKGALILTANVALPPAESIGVSVSVDAAKVLRAVEALVPNAFVDGGIEMLIAALGTVG